MNINKPESRKAEYLVKPVKDIALVDKALIVRLVAKLRVPVASNTKSIVDTLKTNIEF